MRVTIDRSACSGSGLCVFHAPDVFDTDEVECKVVLLGASGADSWSVAAAHLSAVRNAAEACPTRAITIADTNETDSDEGET